MSITFLCSRLPGLVNRLNSVTCAHVNHKSFCSIFSANKIFNYRSEQNVKLNTSNFTMYKASRETNFRLSDYDCIGFDLDNTLCVYKLRTFYNVVYEAGVKYLIENKGYSEELLKPWENFEDFIFKGLVCDLKRGNFLKVNPNGFIFRGSHGTRQLKTEEIEQIYGPERIWLPVAHFKSTYIESDKAVIRVFKDYFDLAGSLLGARIVDLLEKKAGKQLDDFNFWPDVYEALIDSFHFNAYSQNSGNYFPVVKKNIGNYIYECSNVVKFWLKKMREEKKILFVITSSHMDYASLLFNYCLGEDWRDYFDVCVTNAKKPGFFLESKDKRPFLHLDGFTEGMPIKDEDLRAHQCYSQGNWESLTGLFQNLTNKEGPKVLYFGDSLTSDVLPLAKYSKWHPVAIVEEMETEAMLANYILEPPQKKSKIATASKMTFLTSSLWGSFFFDKPQDDSLDRMDTLWGWVIKTKSKIAIPSLDSIAHLPLDHNFSSFKKDGSSSGFYPPDFNSANKQ